MCKRLIAAFLAVILLCPFTSVIASAENSDNTPEQVLLKMFQSYASSITEADFWQCCSVVGESNGATVLYCGFKDPDFDYRIANYAAELLGGYLFTNDPCFIKDLHGHSTSYPLGIFGVYGQDAMPLDWAFHEGIVNIEDVAAMSFPDDNVHIKKLGSELTNAERLILRYYDQCDLGDFSCPLFLYFEDGVVNGYTVCEFSYKSYNVMLGYHPFYCGDYLLYDSDCYPYGPGLFAVMGDEILTMDEAYDNRIFSTLDPVMEICYFDVQIKLGDYNKDGKIGMIDVLALQKYIARVIDPQNENPLPGRELIFDYDKNYTVNLRDVLAMQKKIAKAA